ncbi:hypothetical protein [Paenibacillus physcomitrellae]|uniref:Uncharacterized protein n=1 Tax=Paenibacillus physcomitrellae TaxID=1619311 RepID=A0ABQ1FXS5_9BACL|nr:hypothetical protein [Paenibacillus physcomitrellae]GGA31839.1 hypothetical protein GCM10010917_16230 [Paenibacillus physcomitrellae]
MECIVYFDVVHDEGVKELRGLIFLNDDRLPAEQDYLNMLTDMGYHLRLEKSDPPTFVPTDPGAAYKEIRIRRLDTGKEEDHYEDKNLKSMVANLLPNKPKSL